MDRRRFIGALATFSLHTCVAAPALGQGGAPAPGAPALRVGAFAANPPWEFRQESGEIVGFEVDLVRDVARRLGREATFVNMQFQGLFPAVSSGQVDMAISSVTITPERLKSLSFAQPYYDSDQALAVRAGAALRSLENMRRKVVGVVSASTGDIWTREHRERLGFAEVRRYPGLNEALLDLGAGRIDGFVSDIPALLYFRASQKAAIDVAQRIPTGERYSVMLAKGSPLLGPVDRAIGEMKQDGTLASIHRKWFGVEPDPATSTARVLPVPN